MRAEEIASSGTRVKQFNPNTAWLGELTIRELFVFLLKLAAASLLLAIVAIPVVVIFWMIAR